MPLFDKPLAAVTELDLQALIRDGAVETHVLEWKEQIEVGTDEGTREFLCDLIGFANAEGGLLVVGVAEERDSKGGHTGRAVGLPGIEFETPDERIRTLENKIRNLVEPQLWGVKFCAVPLSSGRFVLIIEVPRSYAAPHAVRTGKAYRFTRRTSATTPSMDIAEIRRAFMLSGTAREQLLRFREDRIDRVQDSRNPVGGLLGATILVHLIPLVAFDLGGSPIDLSAARSATELLNPLYSAGWSDRFNTDGYLTFDISTRTQGSMVGKSASYLQVFRNGILEYGDNSLLWGESSGNRSIPSVTFETALVEAVDRGLRLLARLEMSPPVAILLSVLHVAGFTMDTGRPKLKHHAIDQDQVLAPDVLALTLEVKSSQVLRPALDVIWNACGYPGSPSFDAEAKWNPR